VAKLELYGAARCPFTQELRDWLQWLGHDFVEYDVDADLDARRRFSVLSGGQRSVPLLVEDNKVVSVGWQGRTCLVEVE
jgi:glutaredoxin